jgi:hypothetical protein
LIALTIVAGTWYLVVLYDNQESPISIDGELDDWEGVDKVLQASGTTANANIDLVMTAAITDSVYLSMLTVTEEPLFVSPQGHTLRILIDSDDNMETGYFLPGIGADYLVEIYGQNELFGSNVTILSSFLYVFEDGRDQNDWNGFVLLSPVETFSSGDLTETQVPLFDLGANSGNVMKLIWQTSDGLGNTDVSNVIVSLDGDNSVIRDVLDSLQRIGLAPSEDWLIIDGYFEDWQNIEKYQDTDWNEYQESPESADNPNIDIDKYAGTTQGDDSFFYLSVKGHMLTGVMIPSPEARAIPSFDSGSGPIDIVDPIPDPTEPPPLPELHGEELIYIFLDTNGDVPYGFKVNDSFYANQLIEIRGQHGLILSSELYDYSSTDSMEVWHWILNRPVLSAAAGGELEFMVSGLGSQFKTYFHLISWDDSEDYSDGFWVTTEDSRSRGDPTWTAADIDTNADGAYDVHVADMDGDGDMDIVSASYTDDTIAWYENDGAADPSWSAENIDTNADGALDIHVADMDNDGDLDIVSASDEDEIIAWYENDGATNPSWSQSDIYNDDDGWPSRVYIGDMDGDGDMDIVSVSYNDDTIAWYENDGNANPSWSASDIATSADGAYDVFAADMDGDGDMDILSASRLDDTIAWYENNGASDPSWTASDIATDADGATSVFAADMDNDGDMDIVSASINDDTIAWYENDGNANPSWTTREIATDADYAESVFAADMDNDGDMDIVSASAYDDTIAWYENNGASDPSWTASDIATSADYATSVFAADMDNDGDMDIVSASWEDDTIAWYENTATFSFDPTWSASDIDTNADGAFSVFAADMDNDGDMDIVSASADDSTIAWYENDNSDSGWTAADIDTDAASAQSVFVADMDDDGDMDIVSASEEDDTIAWYENDGNANPSWTASDIATSADGACYVFAADMDNDGDMDIVSASAEDDTIAWYENDGNANPSWTASDIATSADGARSVFVADMDNDGDMDILSASEEDDTIAWYENDGNANPSWSAENIVTDADGANSVFAADMDNDGDMDIVSASSNDDTIAWYEYTTGTTIGPPWIAREIDTNADGAAAVFVADMDNDGDMDIVSVSGIDNTTAWYENLGDTDDDGILDWTASDIATSGYDPYGLFVADMDNDGDMDIIVAFIEDDTIAWYETAIPEFSNIMMPIISVLAIVGLNYRRSQTL